MSTVRAGLGTGSGGFEDWVLATAPRMRRLAFLLTGDRDSAADLLQSAYARVYPRWDRVAAMGSPEAYLHRVMVNLRTSWWRRHRNREYAVEDVPEQAWVAGDMVEADHVVESRSLLAALRRMPERQRATVVLRYYCDLSEAETAEVMHCSLGTVKSNASRNRAAVLTAAGVAAAVVVGYAALAAAPDTPRGGEVVDTPTVSDTPTPSPSQTEPAPELGVADSVQADVDADGEPDLVRLLVPRGTPEDEPAKRTYLEVDLSSAPTETIQVSAKTEYVDFLDTGLVDLDGNGGTEIVLLTTGGGEHGLVTVWTWTEGTILRPEARDDAGAGLAGLEGLVTGGEEVGVSLQDDQLLTWMVISAGSQDVTVWRWALDGTTLVPTKRPGTWCVSFGVVEEC